MKEFKGREGGVRKVASADCRRARATDFSLINDRVFFEFAGGAPTRCPKFPKFPDWKLPKFSSWKFLHSRVYARGTCRYRAGGGWRLRWHRQVLASGSREVVQSDQRRGASETGTVPTARVPSSRSTCMYRRDPNQHHFVHFRLVFPIQNAASWKHQANSADETHEKACPDRSFQQVALEK